MQETKEISAYKQGLRGKILETAMNDFRQKGIRAVKMDDVAAELGISKRTLYEVFENKELLLFEGVRLYQETKSAQMKVKTSRCTSVIEILVEAYREKVDEFHHTNPQFYADLVKYPRVARFLNQENLQIRRSTVKFLERGIYEGYFRDDINQELISKLLDTINRYIFINQWYRQYSIEEIFNNVLCVSLRGICTEKGQKLIDRIL